MELEARLRAFAAVARFTSLTRAAEELGISQPAVSRHLAALEAETGVRLVERGRRTHLTAAGEELAVFVHRAEATLVAGERAVAAWREAGAGRLAIAASGIPVSYLLPPVIGRFHGQRPAIQIELHAGTSSTAMELVRSHAAELAILGGIEVPADLEGEPLLEDEIVLVGPASMGKRRVSLSELRGMTWVSRESGSGTRATVDGARAQLGLRPAGVLEMPSWEGVLQAVAAGAGIAGISRFAADVAMTRGIVILDVARWRVTRTISVLSARGVPRSAPARAFVAALKAAAEDWSRSAPRA